MPKSFKIPTTYTVSLDQVANLLCSAFDPACNAVGYWCEISGRDMPSEITYPTKESKEAVYDYMHWPLNKRGALYLKDIEADAGETYQLDLVSIRQGLEQMAAKFPTHFADAINDRGDNGTADVFVQCCLFGDVIYG